MEKAGNSCAGEARAVVEAVVVAGMTYPRAMLSNTGEDITENKRLVARCPPAAVNNESLRAMNAANACKQAGLRACE